jgi:hypothetical protein
LQNSWQHRQQVVLQQVVRPDQLKQHLPTYTPQQQQEGHRVTRVYFKVLQQGTAWQWLQVRSAVAESLLEICRCKGPCQYC